MNKLIRVLVLVLLISNISLAQENQPTKWRGANGNGVYPDKNLLNSWPENGPEILWNVDFVGVGHSSPAFANGKIYVTGMTGVDDGTLFVLSEKGELIKQINYGKEWSDNYPGVRSTPTIVGNLIYLYSSHGDFVCLDESKNYEVVWKLNVFEDFDGVNNKWGVTETPVVEDDKIYISPGGKTDNVVALNRFTGEKIWSCAGKGNVSAYCTPLLIDLPDRKILVTMMSDNVLGIDRESGKLLWAHPNPNKYSVHANTPLYQDGKLFYSSGYGKGSGQLKISDDGSEIEELWYIEDMDNRMGGLVLIDGYIYSSGQNNREWKAINWENGQTSFSNKDIFKGVVIAADNKLFIYSQRGELALVNVNPEKFDLVSQTKVTHGSAQHWAHPVIHNGVLYIRHGEALVAYKIK
jgi:outer membrane protein assembly factor BamB